MPSWKKVIVSGSAASLSTLTTSGNISGSSTSTGSFGSLEISTATNNRARIRPGGGVANKSLIMEGANHTNASFITLRGPNNGYGSVDFQYGYDQTNSYLSFQQAGNERVRFSGLGKITATSIETTGLANAGGNISGSASSTGSFGNIQVVRDFLPITDNNSNLGSSTKRWANIHSADLQLSNEGTEGNDVDGTTGNWTLQEGEEDIYLINNKTGKKYSIMLKEVKQ